MVLVGAPGAVTVIVPARFLLVVLAVALILNEPFPVRLAGVALEIVNQLTSLVTLHCAFEVTLMVVLLATWLRFQVLPDKVNLRFGCWVTVTLRVGAPGAVTVMMPVRGKLPVWRVVVSLKEPFPRRLVGVVLEILSQFALLVTLHLAFERTVMVVVLIPKLGFQMLPDKVKILLGCWLTVILRVGAPGAVTVITPVRVLAVVLTLVLILKLPFPVRLDGMVLEIVSQLTLLLTVHLVFEVTVILVLLAFDSGLHLSLETVNVLALTVTLMLAVLAPSLVLTVMVVIPGLTPVTRPLALTVAMRVLLELQLMPRFVALLGKILAVKLR